MSWNLTVVCLETIVCDSTNTEIVIYVISIQKEIVSIQVNFEEWGHQTLRFGERGKE